MHHNRQTYSGEVRMSRLDMEVKEVEDNAIRKIAKTSVVYDQSFASVHHLVDDQRKSQVKRMVANTLM